MMCIGNFLLDVASPQLQLGFGPCRGNYLGFRDPSWTSSVLYKDYEHAVINNQAEKVQDKMAVAQPKRALLKIDSTHFFQQPGLSEPTS